MNQPKFKVMVILFLIGMTIVHASIAWSVRSLILKGYADFTIFYGAASTIRRGAGAKLYDEATQFKVQQEFASGVTTRFSALPYNHPPFEALLFIPFTYLPYSVAFLLWISVNFSILLFVRQVILTHVAIVQRIPPGLWALLCLGFLPVFLSLLQGQDSILLLLVYTGTFACLKRNRETSAGVCLAFGLFKPHLVLPFLFFMGAQKKIRSLYGFLSCGLFLLLLSVLIVGIDGLMHYPSYVLHLERVMANGAIVPSSMPNLRGLVDTLRLDDTQIDWILLILSLAIIMLTTWVSRESGEDLFNLQFSLAVIMCVLVSYHCLEYDLSMLMLPALLLVNEWSHLAEPRWSSRLIVAGISLLFFSPIQLVLWLRANQLALTGLWILLLFVGTVAAINARTQRIRSFI